ncbi:hypothetical protein [Pontibacter rugosus]|uniref:Uncharacterized protein n=1 Tax=Pontibacter rugosus TaxID=1745966 RepID=A0ABW3SRY0_9BACT
MKRTYAFLLASAMLMSTGLYSCTADNTTGVETDGTSNNGAGGTSTTAAPGDMSPLDTARNSGSGTMNDTTNNSATTTPLGNQ